MEAQYPQYQPQPPVSFCLCAVGDVPLVWYKDEDHIGYDVEGKKIGKKNRGDALDNLLARNDTSMRTIYDPYNDEEIMLSKVGGARGCRLRVGRAGDAGGFRSRDKL